MLGGLNGVGRGVWVQAGAIGTVGGVAHEAVESGPDWAEDLRRWAVGGLAEGEVVLLGVLCCGESLVLSGGWIQSRAMFVNAVLELSVGDGGRK